MNSAARAFEVRDTADGVELSVTGDLDLATADSLVELATSLIVGPVRRLVIDLAGVGFCDSTGLSGLIKIRNLCDAAGWTVEVRHLSDQVAQVVRITGLGGHLNIDGRNVDSRNVDGRNVDGPKVDGPGADGATGG